MTIRPATSLDIDSLVSLNGHVQSIHAAAYPELFRADTPREEIADAFLKMVDDPSAFWLIAENPEPCGYLYAQLHQRPQTWFRPAHRLCNISHVSIHPDHRRQGVATRLIEALLREARTRDFTRVELDVWSFNEEARVAFKRLGFEVFNERMELRSS